MHIRDMCGQTVSTEGTFNQWWNAIQYSQAAKKR